MTAEEIKAAIDRGEKVYWKTTNYPVIKDSKGQYLITYLIPKHCIGLTWEDGVTLNGKESDFFTDKIPA